MTRQSTVVAVSIAESYGQPSWLLGSFILVGTFWILPVVYFLRFMPLVVRAVAGKHGTDRPGGT